MDYRIARIRRKLAAIPYQAHRSHSFGEETHQFRRGPRLTGRQLDEFERRLGVELPEFLCQNSFWLVSGHDYERLRMLPVGNPSQ